MKFAHKTILVASSVIALSFCISAVLSYRSAKEDHYNMVHEASIETLEGVSQAVSHWIGGKLNVIELLGETIENTDLSPETVNTAMRRPILAKEFELILGGFESDGLPIKNLDSWNPGPGFDVRKRPWYALAREHQKTMITTPYADAVSGEMLISIARNIRSDEQNVGVFIGDVSLKNLINMIATVSKGEQHYVFLFDKTGLIISHPDEKLNGKTLKDLFSQHTLDLSHTGKFQDNIINNNAVKVMLMPIEGLPVTQQWILGMVQDTSEFDAQAQQLGIRAFIATMLSVALCTLILMIVIGKLMQPLVTLRNSLRTIRQDGDLTHRLSVTTKDEIADLSNDFNVFLEYLQRAMHHIKDHAHNIRGNSENMAHSSAQTSQRIDVQVSEIDNLNTAMSEMVLAAESVANNAQLTADAVVSAESQAQAGLEMMGGVNNTITTLSEDMQQAVVAIDELSQVSDNIGSIVTAISSISDQTNLLALNASIEAARAGEAGRGFAVVADEVRSLASKTQQSTEEIDRMIRQLQQRITDAHNAIQNSQNRTEEARNIVMQADQALANIRNNISDINAMTSGTAAAVEQQSATTHAINDNTRNLRDISYQLHESIQEQTDLTQKNANLTHDQDQVLSRFKV